jgi:hypothetical protein
MKNLVNNKRSETAPFETCKEFETNAATPLRPTA